MLSLLKSLQEQGVITQGDYYFAQLIADKQKDKGYTEPVQKFSDFISRTLQLELYARQYLLCVRSLFRT